jgi:two-component system nitrate/nitrite response regulator NarL
VVVADDHPAVRAVVQSLLEGEFQVVGEAGDGAEALALARSLAPDVLVLDVDMPEMDGFAVCAALQGDPHAPAVVFLSVHGGEDYVAKGAASGGAGYVVKTNLYTELREAVRRAATGRRRGTRP